MAARTRELEAANSRLSALVTEREMLLVEVNHRAKNSLAIAASLLAIQGRRQPDPAVRALFEEAQDRLNAMARVHDLLEQVGEGPTRRRLCVRGGSVRGVEADHGKR